MADTKDKEEKKYNRDSNIINVSSNGNFSFFVFLGKKYLKDFEEIEIHSLGKACPNAVLAAESLVRNGYATMERVYTNSVELENRSGNKSKKGKLFIHLRRAEGYEEAVAAFEKELEKRAAETKE